MAKSKGKIHYAWWTLVALCIIIGLGRGSLNNSASLFLGPVSEDLGIGMGSLTLYFSFSAVVTLFFLPIAGKLMAKYDARLVLVGAIVIQGGSFAMFGLMSSVWGWYIFSMPLAVGGVIIMVIAGPVIINQWFKKKTGLALGILTAAAGAFGAITQPAIGKMIASQGWRFSYLAVGIGVIAIVIPVILLLIKKSPQAQGIQPYGAEEIDETVQEDVVDESNQGIEMAVARKSKSFYLLIAFFFLITSVSSFSMHIPRYLIDKGFDVAFTGNIMGIYMIGVLVTSLLIGILIDKLGAKYTAALAMLAGFIAISLLLVFTSVGVITFAVALFGVVSASIGTIGPALTSGLFGNKDYSEIYSSGSLGLGIASIVALPAYGFIFDLAGSYDAGLYTILAMLLISIVCVFFAYKDKQKLVEQGHWN